MVLGVYIAFEEGFDWDKEIEPNTENLPCSQGPKELGAPGSRWSEKQGRLHIPGAYDMFWLVKHMAESADDSVGKSLGWGAWGYKISKSDLFDFIKRESKPLSWQEETTQKYLDFVDGCDDNTRFILVATEY